MNDYKELIANVRICASCDCCGCTLHSNKINCQEVLLEAAADAIEQLIKERDAAMADLKEYCDCDVCKNNNDECLNNGLCKKCSVGKSTRHYWEWRGVRSEENVR